VIEEAQAKKAPESTRACHRSWAFKGGITSARVFTHEVGDLLDDEALRA